MNGKWVGPYHFSRNFGGWGKWDEPWEGAIESGEWDPESRGGISVSLTPVNELLEYELRYDPKIVFADDLYNGKTLLDTTIEITFGDFVHAVLWEIGWHGDPENKADFLEELDDRAQRIKDLKKDE